MLKVSHVRRSRHGLCYSPKVRRVARIVWNHARPSLARALPRRHSGLARLRSPLWLRSLPAGLLANARPPLPATAAKQLPRIASRVAALRASARNVRHPARASCCNARCRLARSLNQALRAVSPRPASQGSPAPRPATANAFASLSPPREALPLQFAIPARAAASRVCRRPATPTVSPAARLRRELARALCDRHHRCTMRSHGSPESSPESNTRMKELAKYSAHANTFHRALPGQLF